MFKIIVPSLFEVNVHFYDAAQVHCQVSKK